MIGKRLFIGFILFIISLLLCLDLFTTNGKPSSFDGLIHMSNIAQYYAVLKDGDFPVSWLGKMANYGMPMALFSQQTVAYVGATFMFIFHNTLVSYNLVLFLFALLSCIFFYIFLREYVNRWSALVGTFLFCFAPYRIINIYIRGAAPEFAVSLFLPLILLSIKRWISDKKSNYYYLLIVSLTLLFLTHPISTIAFSFIIGAYYIFVIWPEKNKIKIILLTVFGGLLSLGIASFYLIPLMMEFKYLYYGLAYSVFLPNSYLELNNLLHPNWFYFFQGDVLTRGHYLHVGSIESLNLICGLIYLIYQYTTKKKIKPLIPVLYTVLFIYLLLITKIGTPIFYVIKPLGNIQHQWRLLSGILFIPPIIIAFLMNGLNKKIQLILGILIIFLIVILRFPQLFGKNYLKTDESTYYSSRDNLYAQVMNTIWTGPTQDYPVKKVKGEIISGQGRIIKRSEHNSWREYEVDAVTDLRLADYTFYFPGWKVYVDNKEVPIEFQDMNYRGVITYKVSPGKHTILVKFTNTKVRLLANIISIFSLGVLGLLIIFRKKLSSHPSKQGA